MHFGRNSGTAEGEFCRALSTSVLVFMPTVHFESRISKPDNAVFGKTESSSQMQK